MPKSMDQIVSLIDELNHVTLGFAIDEEDGGAFVRISGTAPYNHEVLTFDDRTVVNGRQYTYRVRAVDSFGNASEAATTMPIMAPTLSSCAREYGSK